MKVKSSGIQAASAAIVDHECFFCGYSLITDTGTDVIMTVWDSPDSTTTNDTEVGYAQCTDEVTNVTMMFPNPIWCSKGIYAALDAAEGDYIIYYALGQ